MWGWLSAAGWEARYRHMCLSDSNSTRTLQARTTDLKRARDLLLQKMNTFQGDALVQAQADKVRLEVALQAQGEELRALKRQRCSACLAAAEAAAKAAALEKRKQGETEMIPEDQEKDDEDEPAGTTGTGGRPAATAALAATAASAAAFSCGCTADGGGGGGGGAVAAVVPVE